MTEKMKENNTMTEKKKGCDAMLRLITLEGRKLAGPVLLTVGLLTVLTGVLTGTLYREYSIYFALDPWGIGTEYLSLLFPLCVTVPVCWQLYYERRDRFLVYTLPRIGKGRYLGAKWCVCALAAFLILFIPYFTSSLLALSVTDGEIFKTPYDNYGHVFHTLYTQRPVVYALILSLWKGMLGVLTMTFGFVLALYERNIFVILTAPFIYIVLENFAWAIVGLPELRFVTAFEPTSVSYQAVHAASFVVGPLLLCVVTGLTAFYFQKIKKRSIYTGIR